MVQSRRDDLVRLCKKHGIQRLDLFGSATTRDFNPNQSDLDFIVKIGPSPQSGLADSYFGLLHDLELLFGRPVDLVEEGAIRNPYFKRGVDATRVRIYAA